MTLTITDYEAVSKAAGLGRQVAQQLHDLRKAIADTGSILSQTCYAELTAALDKEAATTKQEVVDRINALVKP